MGPQKAYRKMQLFPLRWDGEIHVFMTPSQSKSANCFRGFLWNCSSATEPPTTIVMHNETSNTATFNTWFLFCFSCIFVFILHSCILSLSNRRSSFIFLCQEQLFNIIDSVLDTVSLCVSLLCSCLFSFSPRNFHKVIQLDNVRCAYVFPLSPCT